MCEALLKVNSFSHFFQVTLEPSLPYDSMDQGNGSVVTEFVLLGLAQSLGMQVFLFLFFSLFYVGIILGNLFIMLTVIFDSHLHSPMYILLANLSSIDLGLSSTTVPRMISDLFSGCKIISFHNCMIQMLFFHVMEELRWYCS